LQSNFVSVINAERLLSLARKGLVATLRVALGVLCNPYGPCILGWSQFCFAKLLLAHASGAANSSIFRGEVV
jgi:hypothetical protein